MWCLKKNPESPKDRFMPIIDAHIHLFDIFTGLPVNRPLAKIPFGLISVLEWMGFKRPGRSGPAPGRLIGDWVFMECCRRIQVCQTRAVHACFDRDGVAKAVVLPIAPKVTTDQVLAACRGDDRLIPFASVDLHSATWRQDLARFVAAGCRGLKIHPVLQAVRPDAAAVYELIRAFAPTGLPVCIHVGPARAGIVATAAEDWAHPDLVLPLMKAFPAVPFIAAHMGLAFWPRVIDAASGCDNIFLDTSFQPPEVLKIAERRVGSRRILFGTDFPLLNQRAVIRCVEKAFKGRAAVLEKVFHDNIDGLMKPAGR
jgi:hypothetical protein